MQKTLFKKGIIIAEIIFLFGINLVSSIENTSEDVDTYPKILETIDISEKLDACNHKAYLGSESIYEFVLNDPENLLEICLGSLNYISAAAWTKDNILLGVDYFNGALYQIDLETCNYIEIGGGGTGLNGLTYDVTNEVLYGCSSYDLYKIDPETGEQECIGSFGTGQTHIALAIDYYSICYTWDVKFTGESNLYTVNLETGEATIVGPLGMTLLYGQGGDFCKIDNILYLAGYVSQPYEGNYLFECNQYTGECTLIGQFIENISIGFLTIPYNNLLPIPQFNWTPTIPEPEETITFNASESTDPDGYIKVYEWDWDNDGVYDYKNYSSPIATHIYEEAGYYPVTLRVKDNNFTNNTIKKTVRVGNQPPNPPIIKGSTNGEVGVTYTYSFNSTDDDQDNLSYFIKWGDGTDFGWLGPYPSGLGISLNHSWDEEGTFNISAKTKDIHGKESHWSYLDVTMPKDHIYHWWINWLDRFPLLKQLLVNLMDWRV